MGEMMLHGKVIPAVPTLPRVVRAMPIPGRERALKAMILSRQGYGGFAIGQAMDMNTGPANEAALVGRGIAVAEGCALSGPEIALIRALALQKLALLGRGVSRSAKAPDVSWRAGKADGWANTTYQKRFGLSDCPDHLKLVWKAGGKNGAMTLTPLGWVVALAILTDEEIAAVQLGGANG